MAKVKLDKHYKSYFNDDNQLHREDGPAVIWRSGTVEWYLNNVYQGSIGSNGMRLEFDAASMTYKCPSGWRMHRNKFTGVSWPEL